MLWHRLLITKAIHILNVSLPKKPINLKRTVREITRPLPSDALCNLGKPREIFMFLALSGRAFKRDLAFGGYSDWSFLCISLQLLPSLFHYLKKTLLRV